VYVHEAIVAATVGVIVSATGCGDGNNGSGTLCGIHTYVGEDDMWVSASSSASATHILVSILTVNRYTYPGLLLLL